jgi:hypothetical protein
MKRPVFLPVYGRTKSEGTEKPEPYARQISQVYSL